MKMRLLIAAAIAWIAAAPQAQTPPATAPFFFLQMSDPQFGMFTADKDFVQETANFEFAIATANRLKPAFLVITGDLVNKAGDAAQIAEFRRIAARLDRSIPLYNVAGNHDVENTPTPESIAAYTARFGPDHYTFRSRDLTGIVLNSSLIHTPGGAPALAAAQDQWARNALAQAQREGARHIVIFQHHPWFLADPKEPDQYFNIPLVRRDAYLALFHQFGVKYLFSGHYHRNAGGRDGDIEMITTAPVGMPLGGAKSGLRVAIVRDAGIEHKFYELGELPSEIKITLSNGRQ